MTKKLRIHLSSQHKVKSGIACWHKIKCGKIGWYCIIELGPKFNIGSQHRGNVNIYYLYLVKSEKVELACYNVKINSVEYYF